MGAFNELIIESLGTDGEWECEALQSPEVIECDDSQLELDPFIPTFLVNRGSECMQVSASNS